MGGCPSPFAPSPQSVLDDLPYPYVINVWRNWSFELLRIYLQFNTAMDTAATPDTADFSVWLDGTETAMEMTEWNGDRTLIISKTGVISEPGTVDIKHLVENDNLQDADGTNAKKFLFRNVPISGS